MHDRPDLATTFLEASGWKHGSLSILAGDASNRKYFRVRNAEGKPDAVLMDAPKERGEDVRPFVKVARHLSGLGLSAPEIYAEDIDNGFLLLEDLGDDLFSIVCPREPELEQTLYQAAADTLIVLQAAPAPQLQTYTPELMADLAAEAIDWYALGREGKREPKDKEDLRGALHDALLPFSDEFTVPILRDYHAQNLLWLPGRAGPARVGLLDFQDAMIGHPTYDLVSLLEDARRDVSNEIQRATLRHYLERTGSDPDRASAAYAAMGAQRNLRILMVFARLSLHFGKKEYVDLIPRTWAHLEGNLSHPHLVAVRDAALDFLPEPSPEHLTELKEKCGTHPTQ